MEISQPMPYHTPALPGAVLAGLDIKADGTYVDVTYGGGGHSRLILDRLGPNGRLFGLDQDIDALSNAIEDPRFTFVHSNFAYVANFMRYHGVERVDGLLADLGVSFHHFDEAERGFSFRSDGPLDMRMNRRASLTAATLLATESEQRLADIFYLYGELRQARRLAAAIVRAREQEPITTTARLLSIVKPLVKPAAEKKELAQIFQALRIEVNGEIDVLKRLLKASVTLLRPGGRLCVITYHSLEDRLVKNFIRTGNVDGRLDKDFYGNVNAPLRAVGRVITPDDDEVAANPRSRSAKLRVAEATGNTLPSRFLT